MGDSTPEIKVIKPDDVVWSEAARQAQEIEPPGREFVAAASPDGKFSVGYWERDVQKRPFERPYHEVAYIISGSLEIESEDGSVVKAGPGDIVDTPKGSKGYWRNTEPVRKVWAILED